MTTMHGNATESVHNDAAHNLEEHLERVAEAAPAAGLARTFFWQGEVLTLPNFFSHEVVAALLADVDRVRHGAVRKSVPGYKRSSSTSWPVLRALAPNIAGFFYSPSLLQLLEQVFDAHIEPAPDWDPHACALYQYDRMGDGVGFHYDTSWYRGTRYTVLVGLVNDSSAELECELHTREPQRPLRRLSVRTDPGTVVVFNGDKLRHRVTALGVGQRRTVLSLQYVTDPHMSPLGRLLSSVKDALTYFGVRQVVRGLLSNGKSEALRKRMAPATTVPIRRRTGRPRC